LLPLPHCACGRAKALPTAADGHLGACVLRTTFTAAAADASRCCRAEEVRAKFEKYGPIRDVYLPKDFCERAAIPPPAANSCCPSCPELHAFSSSEHSSRPLRQLFQRLLQLTPTYKPSAKDHICRGCLSE
jgi:hypothetical protein